MAVQGFIVHNLGAFYPYQVGALPLLPSIKGLDAGIIFWSMCIDRSLHVGGGTVCKQYFCRCVSRCTSMLFFQPKNLQELQCVEYFAGVANVYKASYRAGFPSTAVDIEYLKDQEGKENPFDLLSNSGFAPLV